MEVDSLQRHAHVGDFVVSSPVGLSGRATILKKLFGWLSYRWDWLQVEVSSQCNAACAYCPTAIYRKEGCNLLMSLETFTRLSPSFSQTKLVYLQGWGEPFLNPHFFEMVCMAKAAGCRVGTTTNGMLLEADKLTELARSGVDVIAFSLAGCTETNDVFRKGTRLAQVLETIRQLTMVKEKEKSTRPEIHIAYLLLRSGLEEIEQLPVILAGLGISQVVISTLDFVPLPTLECEALIPASQDEYSRLRAQLDRLAAIGKQFGLDIHSQIVAPQDAIDEMCLSANGERDFAAFLPMTRPACTENIQNAVFVSASGEVSPCVFTNLPVKLSEAVAARMGWPYQPMIFGNIRSRSLEAIWQSQAYRAFRHSHHAGSLKGPCQACLKTKVIS